MLPAGAAGAVGVDAQVVLVDLDVDVVADQRRGVDGDEAGVAAVGGVEGAHAHEPVHAPLGLDEPVDVLALHGERGALEPRLVAVLQVVDLDLEAAALEPAQVHAQQHLGPVLRLGAAGAGVDGEDRAALVVLAAEEAQLLAALQVGLEGGDAGHELLQELVVHGVAAQLLTHELLGGLEIGEPAFELGEVLEPALGAAVLGGDPGGLLLVVPEVGGAHALLERLDLLCQPGGVKDSSAASRGARRLPSAARGAHPDERVLLRRWAS